MKKNRTLILRWATILAAGVLFAACGGGGGSDNNTGAGPATFRVTVTNLTHNQPLSPPAMIFHLQGYELWEVGEPVSAALENLAESGDPGDVLSQESLMLLLLLRCTGACAGS